MTVDIGPLVALRPAGITFALVLARAAALVLTVPWFGQRAAPVRVRLLLAAAVALLIAPLHPQRPWPGWAPLSVLLLRECLIGLALALGVLLIVAALRLAGDLLGQVSGLRMGALVDPQLAAGGSCTRLLELTALALLLAAGGHRLLMDALLDTYRWLPPGEGELGAVQLHALSQAAGACFEFGLRAAAPVAAAAMAAQLVLALIGRVQPALRQVSASPAAASLATLGVLLLSIGTIGWLAWDELERLLGAIRQSLQSV